ncbi:MAG: RNA polymerase subunit sigma-70, partial [Pseudomonadota bacterium]
MQNIDKPQLANNVKRLGHFDLPGGGQVVVDGDYAYVGHMDPPHGTTILDISNPTKPHIVSQITLPDNYSHTHKVRVVDDLMFTNYEQFNRHFLRKGDALPDVRKKLKLRLGRAATDAEVASEIGGVQASDIEMLDQARERGYHNGGFCIYDISDRANPNLLCHKKTYGFGVHRFDVDHNFAYMSTEMEGYLGNILIVYDYSMPTDPTEVSRWSMPGQHLAGGEKPSWNGYRNRLHHAIRVGDELWASCWHAGLRVIDASDIRNLKTIGEYDYHPPIPEPTHTVMPLEKTIDGRR